MSYRDSEATKHRKQAPPEKNLDEQGKIQTLPHATKQRADDDSAADKDIDQERSNEESSRYLYNEESDLWYDTVSGSYSRYDERTRTYMPVRVIECQDGDDNNEAAQSGEPDSTATLRLVVQESNVLPVGNVVLVDASGLTVGRDKSWDKRLRLAEMAVSKFHCQIYYNAGVAGANNDDFVPSEGFQIVDVGSNNGTYLNGERLSESKKSSVPRNLKHLDLVQIGSTILQVHLHQNEWPCTQCQTTNNNLVDVAKMNAKKETRPDKNVNDLLRPTILDHRQELALLKKKYAAPVSPAMRPKFIDRKPWNNNGQGNSDSGFYQRYSSSGKMRNSRLDDSPRSSSQAQTLDTPVGGIGDKMLRKMGWKEGQILGRTGTDGILEPITPTQRGDRRGLGGGSLNKESPYQRIHITTRERYNSTQN